MSDDKPTLIGRVTGAVRGAALGGVAELNEKFFFNPKTGGGLHSAPPNLFLPPLPTPGSDDDKDKTR